MKAIQVTEARLRLAERGMCDATFRLAPAVGRRGDRISGTCNLCGQKVGAVIVHDGVARINYHDQTLPHGRGSDSDGNRIGRAAARALKAGIGEVAA